MTGPWGLPGPGVVVAVNAAAESGRTTLRAIIQAACNTELPLVWDISTLVDDAGLAQVTLFVDPVYMELAEDVELRAGKDDARAEVVAGLRLDVEAALVEAGIDVVGDLDIEIVVKPAPVLGMGSALRVGAPWR